MGLKKSLIRVSLLVVLGLLFTACAPAAEQPSAKEPPAEEPAPAEPAAEEPAAAEAPIQVQFCTIYSTSIRC